MKYYITKCALTRGIYSVEAEVSERTPTMIVDRSKSMTVTYHKPDWHETFESAKSRAFIMQEKRLRNLYKQIVKLENLTFDETEVKDL